LSYGAAFSLIVLASAVDGLDDGCYLAQDMDPLTYFPLDVDRSLLATVMEWEGAAKPSLVLICVGDFERYRDRYRHEQAIRGFFVDGGRLFHEIVAALNGLRLNSLRFASFPLSGTFGEALRLEKMRHIPFGAVNISGPGRLTIESLRSCEGLARR
jgi:hypothetical protein